MKTIIIEGNEKQVETIEDLKNYLCTIVNENNECFYLEGFKFVKGGCSERTEQWSAIFFNESHNKKQIIERLYEAIFEYVGNELFTVSSCNYVDKETLKIGIFYGDEPGCIVTCKNIELLQYDKLLRI